MIITDGGAGLSRDHLTGYLLALLAAFTWAGYSVLSRLVGSAPTASVAVFCLSTSALSLPLHLLFEQTVLPQTSLGWASIAGLGLGPVGLAFYVWDIGCKRGDIQILGTSSYAAPLLSTLALIMAGIAVPSMSLLWAALLITAGALVAARASFSNS
jgi:drug/metabolite transporter (DMT)-like permease